MFGDMHRFSKTDRGASLNYSRSSLSTKKTPAGL